MHLTKSAVQNMTYSKSGRSADYRWDDEVNGFGVRVYPSGQKTFVLSYRNAANTKRFQTLGAFPAMSVQSAREMARDLYHRVRQGADPKSERDQKRIEITFSQLAGVYIEEKKHHRRDWTGDQQRIRDHLTPTLGKRKLSEITRSHITKLQISIKERTSASTSNRVIAVLRHMLNWSVKHGYLQVSPAIGISMFPASKPRDYVLSSDECGRLLVAIEADENQHAAALFKLAFFTGRRIGELISAKWEHYDHQREMLTVPDTKAGEQQYVHLNQAAVDVLASVPRVGGNPHIIIGDKAGAPLVYYGRAWRRIMKRSDLPYMPVHALRHNFASNLVIANVPLETVGTLLGHKNRNTTARYAHLRPGHLRDAADRFSEFIGDGSRTGSK